MEATGVLTAGETTSALAYVKGRRGLSPRQAKSILLACMLVIGIGIGAWVSGSWVTAAIAVESALFGVLVGIAIIQVLVRPLMRRALAKRGQPYEQTLTVRLTAEALFYELVGLTMIAEWGCVTDLFSTCKYWVFLAQNNTLVVPRRFFDNPQAEREFIAQAMSRMTDVARARRPDAAKVIGKT